MIASSIEEHERFVKSLEKNGLGMNGDEWSLIADEMNWSVDDVKLYAYWYMYQLQNSNANNQNIVVTSRGSDRTGGLEHINNTGDTGTSNTSRGSPELKLDETKPQNANHIDDASVDGNDNEWTYDESILFDTLSITYDSTEMHRWERIASLIPNKDKKQCKELWEKLYGEVETGTGTGTGTTENGTESSG